MKMNVSEDKFKKWLDSLGVVYVFIDQTPISQAEAFINKVHRPDFFIALDYNVNDNKKLIAVDVKQRTLNPKFNSFKLDKITQEKLSSFEKSFNVPLWVVYTTEANEFKQWYWIGINDIISCGKLINGKYGEFWAINIDNCDTLNWDEDLP